MRDMMELFVPIILLLVCIIGAFCGLYAIINNTQQTSCKDVGTQIGLPSAYLNGECFVEYNQKWIPLEFLSYIQETK